MSDVLTPLLIVSAVYVVAVIAVGAAATRKSASSPEEYFLAGRGLGTLVLFMALFGTNATAFVLVGIPAKAYTDGIGTFGVNAPIIALGIPLTFWAIGSPARRMAARIGALTPAELYSRRFASPAVGYLLFVFFTLYTLPYMVTAVKGATITLRGVSAGAIPDWAGGAAVTAVALIYTTLGGMRATAWTNVVQGLLFLTFVMVAFFLIPADLGGFEAASQAVLDLDPSLVRIEREGLFAPRAWTSWGLAITLTVIAFPHMLVRLMAGKSERALSGASRIYPVALILLWTPVVLIGFWGAAAFPGLQGTDVDTIFARMITGHLPPWLAAFGFLAVLAAVMSTLDAQILTLGSMLTRDVLDQLWPTEVPGRDVRVGRIFGFVVAATVYVLSLTWGDTVFGIARIAFSGYVTLVPTLFLGVRWRRFTAAGSVASIVVGNLVYGLGVAGLLPLAGFLPVFWALIAGIAAAVGVSLITPETSGELTRKAFGEASA
jgi:SSS family solute:Na+ symporter